MSRSFFSSQDEFKHVDQCGNIGINRSSSVDGTQNIAIPNCSQLKNRILRHSVNKEQDLKVYYTNSRSLGNKMNELRALVGTEEVDIIAVTETWMKLDNKHFKTEYNINGYNLYNTDRTSGSKGGGVAVCDRDSLMSCIKTNKINRGHRNFMGRY